MVGVEVEGCELFGREEERAERASKSERWFAKVFWERRILRTAGVDFPWVTARSLG